MSARLLNLVIADTLSFAAWSETLTWYLNIQSPGSEDDLVCAQAGGGLSSSNLVGAGSRQARFLTEVKLGLEYPRWDES